MAGSALGALRGGAVLGAVLGLAMAAPAAATSAGTATSAGAAAPVTPAAAAPAAPTRATDPEPASSPAPIAFTVTLAARLCDSYAQVMANRVRGDAQESLARPGLDSVYRPGQPVDPAVEAAASAACRPLPGWRFTFGDGHTRPGLFSVVKGVNGGAGPTAAGTPLLDQLGNPTEHQLAGAVTVTLTERQAQLAHQHRLWVQGGRVDNPAGSYGFGALRCAVDNGNGNNVEWVGFPAGTRHVFCFAYYVRSPPGAAALVVRQEVTRRLGVPQRFPFTSDASYRPGGLFTLTTAGDPVSATFVRAAGGPYPVTARLPEGWRLASVTCASRSGQSSAAVSEATATVTLAAGDLMTCTYTAEPPGAGAGALTLRAVTSGAVGAVTFAVSGAAGTRRQAATTAAEDSATVASGDDLAGLPAGGYAVTVTPPSGAGRWGLSAVVCDGERVAADGWTVNVPIADGQRRDCVAHLTHRPAALTLRLATLGGTAGGGFTVTPAPSPVAGAGDGWPANATTSASGPPVAAGGSVPQELPFGSYTVVSTPPATTAAGSWRLTGLSCAPGTGRSDADGVLTVELTETVPQAVCTATYELQPAVTLQVEARAEGTLEARTGALVLEVSCADGATGRVVLPATSTGPVALPKALSFPAPTTCTVTGADSGGPATLSASMEDGPLQLPGTVQIGTRPVTVTVVAAYGEAAASPPPLEQQVARLLPIAAIGVGLVGIGALVLLVVLAHRGGR